MPHTSHKSNPFHFAPVIQCLGLEYLRFGSLPKGYPEQKNIFSVFKKQIPSYHGGASCVKALRSGFKVKWKKEDEFRFKRMAFVVKHTLKEKKKLGNLNNVAYQDVTPTKREKKTRGRWKGGARGALKTDIWPYLNK